MFKASRSTRIVIVGLLLTLALGLVSCDSLFVNDGDDDHGITARGGYFYFVDNEAHALRMLDRNWNVVKSWSLSALAGETSFQGITYDGDKLWLSVAGTYDDIYRVDATTDSLIVLQTLDAPPAKRGTVRDIAWDGHFLWALNSGSESFAVPPTLYKLDPADGTILEEHILPMAEPRALTAVGTNGNAYGLGAPPGLFISEVDLDTIYVYRTDKLIFEGAFKSPTPPRGASYIFPVGLCFDGQDFWLINSASAGDHLYRIDYKGVERERIELPYVTPGPLVWATGNVSLAGPPTIAGVSPNTGTRNSLLSVVITGNNFQPSAGLEVSFGAGITTTDITFINAGRLEVELQIATDAAFGPRDVTVTNPDGQPAVGAGMFTVLSVDPLAGYLWVADAGVDSLYKIRIIDTTVVQAWGLLGVGPGGSSQGLTFDGEHIWMVDGGTNDKVIKLNTDGASLSVISQIAAPPNAEGIARECAFDGQYMWTCNSETDRVYQQDTASGVILDSIAAPGTEIRGLVWANDQMYCCDRTSDTVYVYNEGTATWTGLFETPIPPNGVEGNRYATGMCWDGVNFWLVNSTGEFDYIWQVSTDGAVLRTYEVPHRSATAQPSGITFTQD